MKTLTYIFLGFIEESVLVSFLLEVQHHHYSYFTLDAAVPNNGVVLHPVQTPQFFSQQSETCWLETEK